MQFPESWLREFCNPTLSTQQLAETLTMAGLEVEALDPVVVEHRLRCTERARGHQGSVRLGRRKPSTGSGWKAILDKDREAARRRESGDAVLVAGTSPLR